MTPRFRRRPSARIAALVDEVTRLRQQVAQHRVMQEAKDEAMRDFVAQRISQYNAAIRSMNGPKRGESMEAYQARLVAANKRQFWDMSSDERGQ